MLQTLLKIGEWQSQGKSKWDRFLDYPDPITEDKRGNTIKNYILPIIFDLDDQEVVIEKINLDEYDKKKIEKTIPLKTKGGNNKAIYSTSPAKKLNQIYKTFFGKEKQPTEFGELKEAILKVKPSLLSSDSEALLDQIFMLKDQFLLKTIPKGKEEINIIAINDSFNLAKNEKIVFITTYVKAEKFGYPKPTLFADIDFYRNLIEISYFPEEVKKEIKNNAAKLCYASGNISDDVEELNIPTRYSLNKMFVTETKNYASLFDKRNFSMNYQVSTQNQEYLDYASSYLLHQGYKVRIANLDHVIIPQFIQNSEVDLEMALEGIKRKSDLLFNLTRLDYFTKTIEDELDENEPFWINFIAFESDGNFFKSTGFIKDVSNFHFTKIIEEFFKVDEQFRKSSFTDWGAVMTSYDYDSEERKTHSLNFNSIFAIIPLRKDKEKKNKALELFKTILENRKVEQTILYDYFVELILCHFYERYNSYTNIQKYGKDFFYFAVRDGVFKYLAFIQLLNNIKLLNMEKTIIIQNEKTANQYDQAEQEFFTMMSLNQEQRAMFYLGRMLNNVEYLQDGKNKTVIQKVNFNGIDKDDIQRLRIGLIEKAKQYSAMNKVVFIDKKFGQEFDYNNWNVNPKEAIFFLLTGYSFTAGNKKNNYNEEN